MAQDIDKLIDQLVARGTRAQAAQGATLPGGLSAALQGATFGTSDEITAFLRSRFGNTPYEQALEQERAGLAQYREANPLRSTAYEVGGAIVPTIGAALAAPFTGGASGAAAAANAARVAATTGRAVQAARTGATTGAVTGGLQGFGEGEGGLEQRLSGAAGGAALGGVAGGAVGAVTPAITGRLSNILPNAERPIVQGADLERAGRELSSTMQARAAGMPVQPVTMAERLGETGMSTAEALANMPGATRQAAVDVLRPRGEAQLTRTDAALRTVFGDVEDAYERNIALRAQRNQNAIPVLDEALQTARPLAAGEFKDTVSRIPPEYLRMAERRARNEAFSEGRTVDFKGTPTASDLHYLKIGLQKQIDNFYRAGDPGAAKLLEPSRDRIIKTLDEITTVDGNSLYQRFRSLYADPSAMLRAQEVGLDIFKPGVDPRQLRATIGKMGDSEKQEFIVGVMDAIRQRMASLPEGRDATRAIFGSEKQKDVLRVAVEAAYPNPRDAEARFNALNRFLARETEMKGFQSQMLGGSPTAKRQAFQELITGTSVGAGGGAGLSALTGDDVGAGAALGAAAGIGRAGMRALTGRSQDVVGQRLMTTDVYDQIEMLRRLMQQRAAQQAATQRQVGAYPAAAGAFVGGRIGGETNMPTPGQFPGLLQ